jgi:hypothetical protein
MTAPGGASGEGAHDDAANPPGAGGRAPQQPGWEAPWDAPAGPPPTDYPPPAYSPPSYPLGYPASYPFEYQAGYPAEYPQPPGYAGPPYPPDPPQFGGPPPQFGGRPAGYGPPPYPGGYPGGYYPTPDYLGGYGLPEPMQPGMNGMAIASLISSVAGVFCCIGGIVGIVLGTIALDQIKRTRQDGFALAVAGIVIGIATLIVALIIAIFAMHSR